MSPYSLVEESFSADPSDLAWLGAVQEVCYPLSRLSPIWVRESKVLTGPPLPHPTVPHPECHPYCEFTLNLEGSGHQYIGREHQKVDAGSVMLLGPNLPHTAEMAEYPTHAITVYILPIFFLDMGPNGDGARMLQRFTMSQPIADRIRCVPPAVWRQLKHGMLEMLEEFRTGGFGSELRTRSLLMEVLVTLLRWEESGGRHAESPFAKTDWSNIQHALKYMHEHHAEVIYVQEVARAVRVGERQLNGLFRELLGMGCIQYLNAYRVSLAASMLSTSNVPVTTAAFKVGFETLSHFNTTFRRVIGMSPTEYVGKKGRLDLAQARA